MQCSIFAIFFFASMNMGTRLSKVNWLTYCVMHRVPYALPYIILFRACIFLLIQASLLHLLLTFETLLYFYCVVMFTAFSLYINCNLESETECRERVHFKADQTLTQRSTRIRFGFLKINSKSMHGFVGRFCFIHSLIRSIEKKKFSKKLN